MERYNLPDASRRLGASYPACWQAVVSGRVPAERIGRRLFIAEHDLKALAAAVGVAWKPPSDDAPKPKRRAA